MNGWRDSSLKRCEGGRKGPPLTKNGTSNMKANLKKKLPQEDTDCLPVGESLGGPSGSSCPSYSGGGQDRYRYRAPRTDARILAQNPKSYLLLTKNSQSLNRTFYSELGEMVLALHDKRLAMGGMEDQTSAALHEHVLAAVMIVEKIASFIEDPQEQRSLKDAALSVKEVLLKIMKIQVKQIQTRSQLLVLRRELIENKEIVRESLASQSESIDLEDQTHSVASKKKIEETKRIEPFPSKVGDLETKFTLNNRDCSVSEVNKPKVEGKYAKTESLTCQTEEPQLSADQKLERMVQTLRINKLEIGQVENHVAIKKAADKVKQVVKDQLIIENAECDKDALEELQKISDSTEENRLQMKKMTPLKVHKEPPELTVQTEKKELQLQSSDNQEPEEVTPALPINKIEIGQMEGCGTIKKLAAEDENKDEFAGKNAINIKDALEELQTLSEFTTENRPQKEVHKKPLESIKQTETLAPSTTVDDRNDCDKLTRTLKKYLHNTIHECVDTCGHKSLQNKVLFNDSLTLSQAHKGAKRNIELRTLSPAPEAVCDVWYVEDSFKKLTLKRVERDEEEKTTCSGFSEPDGAAQVDSKIKISQPKTSWWSTELDNLRRVCLAARRQYSRSRRRRQCRDEDAEAQLHAVYISHKRSLNAAIKRAKAIDKAKGQQESSASF